LAIPGTDYAKLACAIDLCESGCAHEDLPWPPMHKMHCCSDIPLHAGDVEEVWCRPGEAGNSPPDSPMVPMTVPGIKDISISEDNETCGRGLSMKVIKVMAKASTVEDMEMVHLMKRLLGTRELSAVVGDDDKGTFAAYSA
jgi:hypothetical protein